MTKLIGRLTDTYQEFYPAHCTACHKMFDKVELVFNCSVGDDVCPECDEDINDLEVKNNA